MRVALDLLHYLNVCTRVNEVGFVWLQMEFGSGLAGWRLEFSTGVRLCFVICLSFFREGLNQLPSARVKVWLRSKVTNNNGCLMRQGAASVTSAVLQTQRIRTKLQEPYLTT